MWTKRECDSNLAVDQLPNTLVNDEVPVDEGAVSVTGQGVPAPGTVEELLSPEWLSLALGTEFPGIRVTRAIRGPVVSRVSMNIRFRIECAGGVPDGLAPGLCAKCYFNEGGWVARRTGLIEASFYRDLAPRIGIRTL